MSSALLNRRGALLAIALLAASAVTLVQTGLADAHANQIRTSPAPNSELETAPGRIIVWFSETIEAQLSEIEVFDADATQVDNGDSALDPTETTAMSVTLPELENGTYTVVWRNLSTVDGHRVVGSFLFAVGEPLSQGAQIAGSEQPTLQSNADPWQRWIFFVRATALVGGLVFELLVVAPVLGEADPASAAGRALGQLSRMMVKLLFVSLGAMAVGLLGLLVQQASVTFDVSVWNIFGEPVNTVLFDSDWGGRWIWRALVLVASGMVLAFAAYQSFASSGDDDEDSEPEPPSLITETLPGQALLLLGLGALFLTTISGHNAAVPSEVRLPGIISDFIHLIAASIWVGGLFYLVFGLPILRRELQGQELGAALSRVVPRFSTLAISSAGVLVITGLFAGWMQVKIVDATDTPYGWSLVAKVALLLPLFGIAGVNSLHVSKRLASDHRAPAMLSRLVRAEVVIALLVLLAVGWLASLEPARQYASRHGVGVEQGETFEDTAEGANINVFADPGDVGQNDIRVTLTNLRDEPITNATDVRVKVKFLDEDLGEPLVSLEDQGEGVWSIEGLPITIAGFYQMEVVVIRPDAFDARTAFRFDAASGSTAFDAIRPTEDATWVLFGLELALIGGLLVVVGMPVLRSNRRPTLVLSGSGGVALALGVIVLLNVQVFRVGLTDDQFNPFPPTPDSIELGRSGYASTCSTCHGESGRGDGPGSTGLERAPADLVVHVPLHADGVLFEFIRDGIPGRGMPPQADNLTVDEIWHLVNFLRTFEE